MNDNSDVGFGWVGSGIATLSSFLQTNEIAQYITFGLGILSALITMAYTIYKWAKRANADRKITQEEVDELMGIIAEGSANVAQAAEKKPEGQQVPAQEIEEQIQRPEAKPAPRIEDQILGRE